MLRFLCPGKSDKYALNPNTIILKKSLVSAPPSYLHPIIRSISVFSFENIMQVFFTRAPKIASKGSDKLSDSEHNFREKEIHLSESPVGLGHSRMIENNFNKPN